MSSSTCHSGYLLLILIYYLCVSLTVATSSPNSNSTSAEGNDDAHSKLKIDPSLIKAQKLYLQLFENVPAIEPPPETKGVSNRGDCGRGSLYYSFNPQCRKSVAEIAQQLQSAKSSTGVIQLAKKIRDNPRIHPKAWFTALTMVTLDRGDMRGLWKPHPLQIIPDSFTNLRNAWKWVTKADDGSTTRTCVVDDESFGADNGAENRLWYFREDIQVNAQHWYWHITYPNYLYPGNRTVYHANRRGELFYYYHHNIMGRYNAERLANGLPLIAPLQLQNTYILDPYYSHLNVTTAGRTWADRRPRTPLPESVLVPRGGGQAIPLSLQTHVQYRDRLVQGIDAGFLQGAQGQQISLQNFAGIDILTDALEASNFSVNLPYYGALHNGGHLLIAFAHDPTNPSANPGVMADTAVSMRDVSFYNWHFYLDNILGRHKRTLQAYQLETGDFPLLWRSVRVEQFGLTSAKNQANRVETFWSMKNITLNKGLAFSDNASPEPVDICVKYLNHDDFIYNIAITTIPKKYPSQVRATVRIFLAPRYGPNGKRFTMDEQRQLFFALDAFPITLQPGMNTIRRPSSRSAVTTPWDQMLETLQPNPATVQTKKPYCGCGWPHHLLLPKGKPEGMIFDLFVMVTNGEEDLVQQDNTVDVSNYTSDCRAAYILCGLPHRNYPDARPMGYPFDRSIFTVSSYNVFGGTTNRVVANLDEYVQYLPNAATRQIVIQHLDKVMDPRRATPQRPGRKNTDQLATEVLGD